MINRFFKIAIALVLIVTALSYAANFSYSKDNTREVKPFMEEIVKSFPDVRDVAISPNGNEVYFTIQSYANEISAIVCVEQKNGTYSNPKVAVFSGKFSDMEPCFSPDGLRLYFVSNRPNTMQETTESNYDIWYVERKSLNEAWDTPANMGPPVNTSANEFYPSFADNGNLYFTCDGNGSKGQDDIFVCEFKNGKYSPRVSLSDSINSAGAEFNAFVAPDESYMIYTCYKKPGDFGSGDLYFSRRENGVWEKGVNLGADVNTSKMEYCPFVDTKNGVLYFTSRRNNVNTAFDSQQTLEQLLSEMNRYENGQSRLYQVGYRSLAIPH